MRHQGSHLDHSILYVKNSMDIVQKALLSSGVKLEESKEIIKVKF